MRSTIPPNTPCAPEPARRVAKIHTPIPQVGPNQRRTPRPALLEVGPNQKRTVGPFQSATTIDDARLPDGALKEVANPSLVILQVLVVRQRDRYEVAHGRSIGSPSDSGRTHFAAGDDRILLVPIEQLETRVLYDRPACDQPCVLMLGGSPLAEAL